MNLGLTHRDTDGCICAILLKKAYPDIKIISGTYRNISDYFEEHSKKAYDKIFITDISLDEKRFPDLANDERIHLIDHHPGSANSVIKNKLHSIKYAGCTLTFAYLRNTLGIDFSNDKKIIELVKYGNDYDLWEHNFKTSKLLNRIYYYLGFNKFMDRFKDGFDGFNETEQKFLNNHQNYINDLFQNINHVKLNDYTIMAIISEEIDEVAEYLLTSNTGIDTIFIYNMKLKTLSMRGKYKGVDYGKFLTQFGGGGHKEAAAVRIEKETDMEAVLDAYFTERNGLVISL